MEGKITFQQGMVNIDATNKIGYANIRNMYKTGDGIGLQLSEDLENKRELILEACSNIADSIYRLQDIIGR